MWRPKNWYKTRGGYSDHSNPSCKCRECMSYESGADAILKAVTQWIRSQEKAEMLDEPENFDYFIVRAKDLAELET